MSSDATDEFPVQVSKIPNQQYPELNTEFCNTNSFTCSICKVDLNCFKDLQKHYAEHTALKRYKCQLCEKSFLHEINLKKHEFKHTGLKPYQCHACEKRYSEKLKYNIQCRSHGTEHICDLCFEFLFLDSDDDGQEIVRHNCQICNQQYFYKPAIEDSVGYLEILKPLTCETCGECFSQVNKLLTHYKSHTMEREKKPIYFCNICNEGFFVLWDLNKHEKTHIESGIVLDEVCYPCKICDELFPCKTTLETHYNDCHIGETKYVCQVCDKYFFLRYTFKDHLKSHGKPVPFKCSHCILRFKSKDNLDQHFKKRHLKKKSVTELVTCEVCQKQFTSKAKLMQHSYIHTSTKRHFRCDQCFKRYYNKVSLQRHIKRHGNNFKCDRCHAAFTMKISLIRHEKIHAQVQDGFSCKECDIQFVSLRYLHKHNRTAHPQSIPCYTCNICNKAFRRKYNLSEHYKYHINARPFKCKHCVKSFNIRTHLVRHHDSFHPNLDIDLHYTAT